MVKDTTVIQDPTNAKFASDMERFIAEESARGAARLQASADNALLQIQTDSAARIRTMDILNPPGHTPGTSQEGGQTPHLLMEAVRAHKSGDPIADAHAQNEAFAAAGRSGAATLATAEINATGKWSAGVLAEKGKLAVTPGNQKDIQNFGRAAVKAIASGQIVGEPVDSARDRINGTGKGPMSR